MKKAERGVTRREFTQASINALFVGMGVSLSGCGGGGGGGSYSTAPSATGPATTTPPVSSGSREGTVSANHGHSAVVTAAQLQAGGAVSLNVQGTADHSHSLELGAAEVRDIAAGARVSKATNAAGTRDEYGMTSDHDHIVGFN